MNAQSEALGRPVLVLLAAGEGRRFGGVKQLAEIAGEPMCRRVAGQLLALGSPLVVVTGAHAEEVEHALHGLPLETVRNGDWQRGLGNSIACGARHVRECHSVASGILVCLADQPSIDTGHYRRMLARHRETPGRVLATRHDAVTGPPVLFPADLLAELASWKDGQGAHALLEREAARLEDFRVREHLDVDTPEDLERVRKDLQRPSCA